MVKKSTLLILAANGVSRQPLDLEREVREIQAAVRSAGASHDFSIAQEWAVRAKDILSHLLRHRPAVVHLCGHGWENGDFSFDVDNFTPRHVIAHLMPQISRDFPEEEYPLVKAFSLFSNEIRCVVINACSSAEYARGISRYIPCTIGMQGTVSDLSAIAYAMAFYDALVHGNSVAFAHQIGQAQLSVLGEPNANAPQLFVRSDINADDILVRLAPKSRTVVMPASTQLISLLSLATQTVQNILRRDRTDHRLRDLRSQIIRLRMTQAGIWEYPHFNRQLMPTDLIIYLREVLAQMLETVEEYRDLLISTDVELYRSLVRATTARKLLLDSMDRISVARLAQRTLNTQGKELSHVASDKDYEHERNRYYQIMDIETGDDLKSDKLSDILDAYENLVMEFGHIESRLLSSKT